RRPTVPPAPAGRTQPHPVPPRAMTSVVNLIRFCCGLLNCNVVVTLPLGAMSAVRSTKGLPLLTPLALRSFTFLLRPTSTSRSGPTSRLPLRLVSVSRWPARRRPLSLPATTTTTARTADPLDDPDDPPDDPDPPDGGPPGGGASLSAMISVAALG